MLYLSPRSEMEPKRGGQFVHMNTLHIPEMKSNTLLHRQPVLR